MEELPASHDSLALRKGNNIRRQPGNDEAVGSGFWNHLGKVRLEAPTLKPTSPKTSFSIPSKKDSFIDLCPCYGPALQKRSEDVSNIQSPNFGTLLFLHQSLLATTRKAMWSDSTMWMSTDFDKTCRRHSVAADFIISRHVYIYILYLIQFVITPPNL